MRRVAKLKNKPWVLSKYFVNYVLRVLTPYVARVIKSTLFLPYPLLTACWLIGLLTAPSFGCCELFPMLRYFFDQSEIRCKAYNFA